MIKCDFCGCPVESTRAHLIVGPAMSVQAMNDKGEAYPLGIAYDEHWAACDVCHARFMSREFDKIISDVLSSVPDAMRDAEFVRFMREGLYQIYYKLQVLQ